MGTGWAVVSTLIGGIVVGGGIGYLIDWLVGTQDIFTGIGFVIGAAGGIYAIALTFGRGDEGHG
jgi:F0F1-type ATP synthase assembly protein I